MAEKGYNVYKDIMVAGSYPVTASLPSWTPIERPYILERPSSPADESFNISKDLNTYRNTGYFQAYCQPIQDTAEGAVVGEETPIDNISVASLFNPICAVGYNQYLQVRQNAPLIDFPSVREEMQKTSDCSIKALVEATRNNQLGKETFKYSDFMYCTYLGRVSNNYLITLRRFSTPATDHINFIDPFSEEHQEGELGTETHKYDIGRLVTWLGTPGNEIENILKWNVKMPYRDMESKFEDGGGGGESSGPLGAILNATTSNNFRSQMVQGYSGSSTYSQIARMKGPIGSFFSSGNVDPPYSGSGGQQDPNKTHGPIDVIKKTTIRDQGLEFGHEFELTFDYQLRSYDGINPRAAMHDLIGNILAVTYNSGPFWRGAYRGGGASQSNVFANLPIWKLDGNSSFSDVVGSFLDSGKSILKGWGGMTGNPIESLGNIVSTLGKGLFSAILGAGLNKLGRPAKGAIASLLSPAPTGLWHVTIGNPWHPILSMGNMVLDGTEVSHYGPLGLDDFPTGLRVKIKLKHGKGRDATMIEQMYMQGEDRIYTPMTDDLEKMFKTSTSVKAKKPKSKKTLGQYIAEGDISGYIRNETTVYTATGLMKDTAIETGHGLRNLGSQLRAAIPKFIN